MVVLCRGAKHISSDTMTYCASTVKWRYTQLFPLAGAMNGNAPVAGTIRPTTFWILPSTASFARTTGMRRRTRSICDRVTFDRPLYVSKDRHSGPGLGLGCRYGYLCVVAEACNRSQNGEIGYNEAAPTLFPAVLTGIATAHGSPVTVGPAPTLSVAQDQPYEKGGNAGALAQKESGSQ